MLRGLCNDEIALQQGRSVRTIEVHTQSILDKCNCTRSELTRVCCVELVDDERASVASSRRRRCC
jgi:DNA-binding NarL/FixJ family response regulator